MAEEDPEQVSGAFYFRNFLFGFILFGGYVGYNITNEKIQSPEEHIGASKWQKQLACMKELPEFKSRGVSFSKEWEKTSRKVSNMENKSLCSVYKEHMDIARSPNHAMEFLCRSWSPSASDFQQMFPSSNLFMSLNADERIEQHGEIEEHEERKVQETLENQALNSKHKANEADKTWMDFSHMKGWLKGKSLTNLFRSQREKKKEEVRLHTAKLHAALSLTQLAAAIAGFATNGSSTEAQDHIKHLTSSNAGRTTVQEWDQDMGVVVASAAALLTAVCAEAAEALGAKRARVASAVMSGLATQTPIDMITLTATAATCLRGAATLESRAKAEAYFPRIQELLKVGVQTLIITPSGDRGLKWVRIHLKQRQPTLSFRKKYLGGALTASKQYKIVNVLEEIKDDKGSNFLSLQTNKGIIKLLFDNEKQSIIFVSAISNLLQIHNTCEIMESRKL